MANRLWFVVSTEKQPPLAPCSAPMALALHMYEDAGINMEGAHQTATAATALRDSAKQSRQGRQRETQEKLNLLHPSEHTGGAPCLGQPRAQGQSAWPHMRGLLCSDVKRN